MRPYGGKRGRGGFPEVLSNYPSSQTAFLSSDPGCISGKGGCKSSALFIEGSGISV